MRVSHKTAPANRLCEDLRIRHATWRGGSILRKRIEGIAERPRAVTKLAVRCDLTLTAVGHAD